MRSPSVSRGWGGGGQEKGYRIGKQLLKWTEIFSNLFYFTVSRILCNHVTYVYTGRESGTYKCIKY